MSSNRSELDSAATSGLDAGSNHSNWSGCEYNFGEFLQERFFLVAFVMTSVCVIGTLGNLLVIAVLLRPKMRSSSSWFLVILATFDTSVMVVTILLYVVEVIYDYTRSYQLYEAWFSYVRIIYVLSHIFQVATVSLTVAATVERFMSLWTTAAWRRTCVDTRSLVWIAGLLLIVVMLTITKYWELEIKENLNCTNFGRYTLSPSTLLLNPEYQVIYSVWLSNILFVFLPFFLLAALNSFIFYKMRQLQHIQMMHAHVASKLHRYRQASHYGGSPKREKNRQNSEATVVLLVVVFVFLICNLPSVLLNVVEHINNEFLHNNRLFYAISRDCINVLTVINSSANFIVYMVFGREFRAETARLLCGPCLTFYRRRRPRPMSQKMSVNFRISDPRASPLVNHFEDPRDSPHMNKAQSAIRVDNNHSYPQHTFPINGEKINLMTPPTISSGGTPHEDLQGYNGKFFAQQNHKLVDRGKSFDLGERAKQQRCNPHYFYPPSSHPYHNKGGAPLVPQHPQTHRAYEYHPSSPSSPELLREQYAAMAATELNSSSCSSSCVVPDSRSDNIALLSPCSPEENGDLWRGVPRAPPTPIVKRNGGQNEMMRYWGNPVNNVGAGSNHAYNNWNSQNQNGRSRQVSSNSALQDVKYLKSIEI